MDRVYLSAERSVEEIRIVAVGIYKDGKHIGALCRDPSSKNLLFIHLAFHEELRIEDDTSKCEIWIEPKLEDEVAGLVAAQARLIFRKNSLGKVPYGFSSYTGYFGAQGEIRWSEPGRGLTCATFVLAIFDRGGVQLLKSETWPIGRKEDIEFQNWIMTRVENSSLGSTPHVAGMKKDIGKVRFRVLEVGGAVAGDSYPVEFATAESNAQQLQEMLRPKA